MMIAGIDEAGKGPVIGPMCIGGVKIEESRAHILKVLGVADSKKLTPRKREQLAAQIKKHADSFFILEVSPSQIDELRKIMRPKIFLEVFTIPAIFSREPLGLAASVTFPFSST